MSGFGMLATALAGGAGVIGKQAGDDIEAGRKADLMRQEADIREQAEKRLIEFRANSARTADKNKLVDAREFSSSDETLAASSKVAAAAGKVARSETLLAKTDIALRDADKANADADAAAATERQIQALDAKAKDPRVDAAQRKEADLAAQRLREEVKIRGDGAIRVATATAAAQGKVGKQSLSDLIAEKEKAIGRSLSQQEKEAVAGLGKSENTTQALRVKLAEEAANKALENKDIKPEEKAAFVKTQLQGYAEEDAKIISQELLRNARKDGTEAIFIAKMKAQGADDATIIKLGVTKDELKKATAAATPAPTTAPTKKRGMLEATENSATRALYERGGGPQQEAADEARTLKNQAATKARNEAEAKASADPDIQALMRSGRDRGGLDRASREKLSQLRAERYGLRD